MSRRAIIIIPRDQDEGANLAASQVDRDGSLSVFDVPLLTDGEHTHYWCNWGGLADDEWAALVERFGPDNDHDARMYDGDEWLPADVLADLGLTVPELKL